MIVNRLHKYQRSIATFMMWFMGVNITLPAFSGTDNSLPGAMGVYYASHSMAKQPGIQASLAPHRKEKPDMPPKKSVERPIMLQSAGPSQPEMSTFQSVDNKNLVDPFTGDFSYNIPLLDVGGYPVNIHYASGISPEQEASWVGLGWNINPGSISRNMRGLPDDFNGEDQIEKTFHTKPNLTVEVEGGGDLELVGVDAGVGVGIGVNYNTYRGYGLSTSAFIKSPLSSTSGSNGSLSGSLSLTNNSGSGAQISANLSFSQNYVDNQQKIQGTNTLGGSLGYSARSGLTSLNISMDGNRKYTLQKTGTGRSVGFGIPASISFNRPTFVPGSEIPYTSLNGSFKLRGGASFELVNVSAYVSASMSSQFILPKNITRQLPAYGYLYYTKAANDKSALLDFNRENDGVFVDMKTPAVSIPQYTNDVYIISAEGTGGSFRPYRSDAGYMYSPYVKSGSGSVGAGVDVGFGKVGVNVTPVIAETVTQAWTGDNKLRGQLAFQQTDTTFESVVFRNPTEMPIQSETFLNSIGRDALIRPALEGEKQDARLSNQFDVVPNGINTSYKLPVRAKIADVKRNKRNQVISYLTAEEAAKLGLDSNIVSYDTTYLPYASCDSSKLTFIKRVDATHKKHHLSEITVLNPDGRRYVYGIPAYTLSQTNMTFAVNRNQSEDDVKDGLTSYASDEVTPNNNSGIDGFFSSEKIPAYAHSFLLTGILTPDYKDITGDGITADDLGDAVKFNYTRVYNTADSFCWRTPSVPMKAAFSEGLHSYKRDDKANIVYGKKEVWYLQSIVSKNLVAVFRSTRDRTDVVSMEGVNGNLNTQNRLLKLTRIDLYSKADLVASTKIGKTPKPIKSVHLEYDYALCKGADPNNSSTAGKLTLRKIWFTYNGNDTKKNNPYVFSYSGEDISYHRQSNDVWGNYKPVTKNPLQVGNDQFPYINQVKTTTEAASVRDFANTNAAAWSLTDIQLPSRGKIKVSYEADDYGFVQDKRAMQLFSIAGLGETYDAMHSDRYLYEGLTKRMRYVFVDVPEPVYSRDDIKSKYLDGVQNLYLKFAITMPTDQWGSGEENVPMVCDIDTNDPAGGYGVVTGNHYKIWIKVKEIDGKNPFMYYAFQFLRENLPAKAYPGSETGNRPDIKTLANVVGSQISNIVELAHGFEPIAITARWCRKFTPERSFIKLSNPSMKKIGGGLRVKRIELFDQFNEMASGMKEAVYGQEYSYTTTATVLENSVPKKISISSGVATFEPFTGGEENPLKGLYAYQQQQNPLGPVNFKFVDTPFCQSLYPAANVGYSRVTVQTINKEYVSANGKEVYEFYTYKDFPTRWSFTTFDDNSRQRFKPDINNFLKINAKHYLSLTQGFRVVLNDMHGKPKSHAFYSESDPDNYTSFTNYHYKTKSSPGIKTPVLDPAAATISGPEDAIRENSNIGQFVEIMSDFREQSDFNATANIQLNGDLIYIPPFISFLLPTYWGFPQWEKTRFRIASTLKIVNEYGILDSIYAFDKGSAVSTKNLVYDAETGNVVLSRTNNEFKDPVYNYSYPAHWAYPGMGPAYKNIHAVFKGYDIVNGRMMKNNSPYPAEINFESGDECLLTTRYSDLLSQEAHCGPQSYNAVTETRALRAWAFDGNKGTGKAPAIFFIDKNGNPVNAKDATIKIQRSGHRNFTDANIGNVTLLSNPVEAVGVEGQLFIKVDNAHHIVNASAVTYRDCWKVDNFLYAKDTTVGVTKFDSLELDASVTLARYQYKINGEDDDPTTYNTIPKYTVASRDWIEHCSGDNTTQYFTKAILKFQLSQLQSNATINTATLKLWPQNPKDLWPPKAYGCGGSHHNHDWSSEINWQTTGINAKLRRLSNNYNSLTKYVELAATTSNSVTLTGFSSDFSPKMVSCTNLIKDLILNPSSSNNLVIEDSVYSDGVAFMSFAAESDTIPLDINQNLYPGADIIFYGGGHGQAYVFHPPLLTVHYSYPSDSTYTQCKTSITDTTNPYRWGIYGNWRPERSYVFYGERDAVAAGNQFPDTRKGGALHEFIPFWNTSSETDKLVSTTDTTKWVWNASTRLVNNKGAEIENVDALGRYTSMHFGYNDNLPVATVQNAQYQEAVFDGFEDYQYKDNYCATRCPNPRFADFTKGGGTLSSDTAHTGLYSLRMEAGSNSTLRFDIKERKDTSLLCTNCGISSAIVKDSLTETIVTPSGVGLKQDIYFDGTPPYNCEAPNNNFSNVNFNASNFIPCAGVGNSGSTYSIQWNGFVQVNYSGTYTFSLATSNLQSGAPPVMYINGVYTGNSSLVLANLEKGHVYPIHISCYGNNTTTIQLYWQSSSSPGQTYGIVPTSNLYPDLSATSSSSYLNVLKRCSAITPLKADMDKLVLPAFSVLQPANSSQVQIYEKYIVTAWIREEQPCSGSAYTDASIDVGFNGGAANIKLKATGVIIEGWQRMESDAIPIPSTATTFDVHLSSTSTAFYVDDIRIHPFNAMMKSMVYNPLNLRLMAELDENNYGTFYEYDDEGTLVRVKKETERGIKTITETRSALYKQ